MWDKILFGQLPYVFIAVGIVGTIYRYMSNRFSWSSQSSQFVENKTLFYGSFPWHYGILIILVAHIVVIFIPSAMLAWNSVPARLYAFEFIGLALAFLALIGLLILIYRRLTDSRVRSLTTSWDILVLIVLIIQVVTGIGNAIFYRWGSSWYAAAAVPWIWSIITFNPSVDRIAALPLNTKIHIFNAMVFIGIIPFTRLVHVLAFINPLKYLTRPYQVVRWYDRNESTEALRQLK